MYTFTHVAAHGRIEYSKSPGTEPWVSNRAGRTLNAREGAGCSPQLTRLVGSLRKWAGGIQRLAATRISAAWTTASLSIKRQFATRRERLPIWHSGRSLRIVVARQPGGLDFLGYQFEAGQRWPRAKSLKKLKDTVRAHTRRKQGQRLAVASTTLNRTLQEWFEYFQHSHRFTFARLDAWVRASSVRLARRASVRPRHPRQRPARLYLLTVFHESVAVVWPTLLVTVICSKGRLTSSMGSRGTMEPPATLASAWSMCW